MHNYKAHVEAQLESQRFLAEYNSRPEVEKRELAQVLAKDLRNALDAGNRDEARRVALALRPIIGFLPEGE